MPLPQGEEKGEGARKQRKNYPEDIEGGFLYQVLRLLSREQKYLYPREKGV